MPDLIMKIGIMLFMVGSLGGVGLRVSPCEVLRPLEHTGSRAQRQGATRCAATGSVARDGDMAHQRRR